MTEKARPSPRDIARIVRSTMRGSAVDPRRSFIGAARRAVKTPADSPLRLRDVDRSPEYGDLTTSKVGVGDLAPEIDLAFLDQSTGERTADGQRFRLSTHRDVRPVALVFGSYT